MLVEAFETKVLGPPIAVASTTAVSHGALALNAALDIPIHRNSSGWLWPVEADGAKSTSIHR
jgi:hypothetical protein